MLTSDTDRARNGFWSTLGLLLAALVPAACSSSAVRPAATAASAASLASHASTTLRIDGDIPARTLSVDELRTLGPVEVEWKHKDQARTYTAVPLEAVLRSAGFEPGAMGRGEAPSEKRAGWKFAVVATASDGFQAAFTAAELWRGMGTTEAYVAFAEGGQPIDAAAGPLRLLVPSDGEASRSVRNLQRLTLLDLRRFVASGP